MNWMSELFFDAGNARLAFAALAGAGWLLYQAARELCRAGNDLDDPGGIVARVLHMLTHAAHVSGGTGARHARAPGSGGARCGTG